jgi:hypothetical protein
MQAVTRERPSRATAGTGAPWRPPSTVLTWHTSRSAVLASLRGTALARHRQGDLLPLLHA